MHAPLESVLNASVPFYRSLLKRKEERRRVGTERTAYGKKEAEMWTKDVFKDSGFCLVELHRQDNCVSGNTR